MSRTSSSRACGLLSGILAALVLAWSAAPAAQTTGIIKGKIVDTKNQPVEGAEVVIESKDSGNRRFKVRSNKRGEYMQIGLQPGVWSVTATKEGVGTAMQELKVSIGASEEVNLTLSNVAAKNKEEAAKEAAMRKVFDEGVAASKEGNNDLAIAKFTEALQNSPDCYACHFNIGIAYIGKKDFVKAEESLLAAAKANPQAADPYNQLATLYNQQKQFDKAAAMAAEAGKRAGSSPGGASPESLFNQGVVLWNASKVAEAKAQFEAALKAKPDYADAHYWVGMASLNQGNMADAAKSFESYLKFAPTGQYAEQAKGILSQIKK
jgi:tetratricopeptide (TPR) repeat protein